MEPVRRTEVQLSMAEYRDARDRWVDAYGSERLKLAKKLGLLGESDNIYREERRNLEKEGWMLPNEMPVNFRTVAIHNPSMEALRALEHELKKDPDVTLTYVQWKEDIAAPNDWRGQKIQTGRGMEALSTTFIGLPVYRWIKVK